MTTKQDNRSDWLTVDPLGEDVKPEVTGLYLEFFPRSVAPMAEWAVRGVMEFDVPSAYGQNPVAQVIRGGYHYGKTSANGFIAGIVHASQEIRDMARSIGLEIPENLDKKDTEIRWVR